MAALLISICYDEVFISKVTDELFDTIQKEMDVYGIPLLYEKDGGQRNGILVSRWIRVFHKEDIQELMKDVSSLYLYTG